MSLIEELELVEARMTRAFELRRFDAFRQLVMERISLLRRARKSPERDQFLKEALECSQSWVPKIDGRLGEIRTRQVFLRDQTAQRARAGHRISRSC